MKTNEATSEDEIWAEDCLMRNEDAKILQEFLLARYDERSKEGREGSYVLNLDAAWGEGKTFFLTRLQKQFILSGYMTTYVNAWQEDAGDDPLTAVLSSIHKSIVPYLRRDTKAEQIWRNVLSAGGRAGITLLRGAATKFGEKYFGVAAQQAAHLVGTSFNPSDNDRAIFESAGSELGKEISNRAEKAFEDVINEHRRKAECLVLFRKELKDLLDEIKKTEERKMPLFVLIDELDRCQPIFAINLLEKIKHIFDISGLVFVIATDTVQLSHSVRAVYGSGFSADKYLLRFFQRRYVFKQPKMEHFVNHLFNAHPALADRLSAPLNIKPIEYFRNSMIRYGLTLRDVEQIFDLLRTFASLWQKEIEIELPALLPLLVSWQQGRSDVFATFARGDYNNALEKMPMTFSYTDYHTPRALSREIRYDEIEAYMLMVGKMPLHMAVKEHPNDSPRNWVVSRFQNEYERLMRAGQTNSTQSALQSYAAVIGSVARLTQQ